MSEFKREERYIVIRRKDLGQGPTERELREKLYHWGVPTVECVVVEHDWPNYEDTWKAIQRIVAGAYEPDEIASLRTKLEQVEARVAEARKEFWQKLDEYHLGTTPTSTITPQPAVDDCKNGQNKLAAAMHYPDCWDTAAYPDLASAVWEVCTGMKCSTCAENEEAAGAERPHTGQESVIEAWKVTGGYYNDTLHFSLQSAEAAAECSNEAAELDGGSHWRRARIVALTAMLCPNPPAEGTE